MPPIATAVRLPRLRSAVDEDGLLLRRAANGDDGAFEDFHERHADALVRYCHHLLGSRHDAEDAVQQSFFSAYREIAAGRLPDKPKPWLYAIARNRSLSTIRSRREQPAEFADASTLPLTDEVERRDDLRELVRDVNRLPEDQRSAIVLFELAGLAQADIAQVLGREPEQVKSLVYQARTTLMARRSARDLSCKRVQQRLAVAQRGELNSRTLRHHLDGCVPCTQYLEDLRRHRRRLALIFPAVPVLAASPATGGAAVAAAVGKAGGANHTMYSAAAATGATLVAGAVVAVMALGPDAGSPGSGDPRADRDARVSPAVVTPARSTETRRAEPKPKPHRGARPPDRVAPPKPLPGATPAAAAERRAAPTAPTAPDGPPAAGPPPREPDPPPAAPSDPPPAEPQAPPAPPAATVPPPTVVSAPPVVAPPPPPRHDNGNHFGQIRNPNNGNHNGQGP